MKILMISDIHLGVKKNSDFFLNVIKDFFAEQVHKAIVDNDVEQVWILGDFYDDRYNTNVLVDNVAIDIVKNLLQSFKKLEIKLLTGNHDIYYKNSLKVSSLKKFEKLNPRVEVVKDVTEYDLDGCKALAVPWLVHGSDNWSKFKAVTNEYEETGKSKFDLCMGHFEINGFEVVKNVFHEDGLKQSEFEAFGNVFSGHFHIRNKIKNIQYLGSPYEITWNDYGNVKGIHIFDTDTQKTTFIENTSSPKHKHIKLSSLIEEPDMIDEFDSSLVKFHIDQTIDEADLSDLMVKIDTKKPFNMKTIDERYDQEIENDDVEVDEDMDSDALQYALDYIEQLEHPEEIDVAALKNRIIALYQRTAIDDD